jgi:hypothetical protein
MWHVSPNVRNSPPFVIGIPHLSHGSIFPREKLIFLLSLKLTGVIFYMNENPVKNYLPFLRKNFIEVIAQKSVGLNGFQLNGMAEASPVYTASPGVIY